ncbi:FixH family protein [Pseudorhodoplanes sinuspersici]|nr:FixH family protein [Pseudorhodoplanes sinuspersici]RKE67281.1 nitrogen fixation protein FixH [Pseudorhodoplanes sinuspersici]
MNANMSAPRRRGEITGKTVLICFISFFGIVAAVNAIMVRAAVTTFAGTQTDSAYRAGLAYKGEEAAAATQTALHWTVDGRLVRDVTGDAVLTVDVKDAKQSSVVGIDITARLGHPLNARLDRTVVLSRIADGTFRGATDAPAGQWTLTLEVMRDQNRLYRSETRVVLK